MKNKTIKVALIILCVLLLLSFLLVVLFKPALLQTLGAWLGKAWIWLVGLGGGIALGIKKLFSGFGGDGLNEISTSNEQLKEQLKKLEEKVDQTNTRYELEKALYKKDIELLEYKLAVREKEIKLLDEKQKALEEQSDEDYWDSLSEAQKARIQKDIDDHTGPFLN